MRRLAGLQPPVEAVVIRSDEVVRPAQVVSPAEGESAGLRRALATRIAHITELELHLKRQSDRHASEMAELRREIEQLRTPGSAERAR
jgi:threonine aldolase